MFALSSFSISLAYSLSLSLSLSHTHTHTHTQLTLFLFLQNYTSLPCRFPPAPRCVHCALSPAWHTRAPVSQRGAGFSQLARSALQCSAGRRLTAREGRTAPRHTCSADQCPSAGRSGKASLCTCPEQRHPDERERERERESGCKATVTGPSYRVKLSSGSRRHVSAITASPPTAPRPCPKERSLSECP